MRFREFANDLSRVLKHATPMMLAQVIPLGASFALIAVALALGRADFAAIIGTTATISGLGTLINVGIGIGTLRELAVARTDERLINSAIATNLRLASAVSFIVIAVSAATAVTLSLATPHSSDLVVVLWIALILQLPANALSSHTSVLAAAFQHLGREKDNLVITLTRTLIGLAIGLAIVVFVSDPLAAIALQSVVASLMVIAMLVERRRRLARTGLHVRILRAPDFSPRRIGDRVLNSLDGAVFMVLFMVAQLVAASISVEVAAQVAAGVALCRTIIIPLKMIGQTAGRMSLQDRAREPSYRMASYGVVCTFVVPLALSLILLSAFGASPVGDPTLGLLISLQLLLEPFAGSLFAYMKVTFGATAGLLGLILTYLVLAPATLIICRFTAPSAVGLWAALLLVRLLFSVANLAALRTLLNAPHPEEALAK
ncbi:MAG: uncharacterized protein K0R99_2539 [Microbacterium sp.]|uniref:hypothetical protein n=1 Tax=Microbacterium sp. TaxID=51671 RepID=UPI00261C9AFB|nr:hypothetical protein [Microbacterium sp.]MDF2561093.1 uncharacterized protein [Microbacterium sp.]